MRKAGLDESQVGIKIAGRNITNLRYADDTTLMVESEEELKSLLMRVKEESAKVGLKLNIKKTKTMASVPLTSWQIDGGRNGVCRILALSTVTALSFPAGLYYTSLRYRMVRQNHKAIGGEHIARQNALRTHTDFEFKE
ncbi:putative uncharacterized transposon-derived protein F52C9.6 [Varanus komodoensis]|nr:putative uncharacterized transposon-derived protein F52C9.6 [Varanus komodoensis]